MTVNRASLKAHWHFFFLFSLCFGSRHFAFSFSLERHRQYKHTLVQNQDHIDKAHEIRHDNSPLMPRRALLSVSLANMVNLAFISSLPQDGRAAETVGKDENCNQSNCLGVWDGLLADCPHNGKKIGGGAGCTSSQDDTPGIFAEPWDYSEATSLSLDDWQSQMRALKAAIELVSAGRGDRVSTLLEQGRYLRVVFVDAKTQEQSTGEFYFTPNDTTVQFRVAALDPASSSLVSLSNRERCEMIRKKLRYEKLPVLRNRQRSLFFIESDLDTFGPGSASLGPPAEMRTGELEGRQDVDPRLKIDLLQQFPRQ